MRRLLVWVPEGRAADVREAARRSGATQALSLPAEDDEGRVDLLLVQVPNVRVEQLVSELGSVDDLHVSMFPQGVLTLEPPASQAPQQVVDVTLRSPLEILLSGLQSIGSWTGFLTYAALAGVIVWVGLFTNTVFLLIAAMLIAPFAGPAMNTALATARGDGALLRRSIGRYVAALTLAGAVAALFSIAFRQSVTTAQMVSTSSISTAAVVLPLAAGAAGAINLAQSDRSSLVSGAATGMLVAAALAPPVGVVGMATVMGQWAMVRSGLFLLALQLVGINLAGAAVFRLVGVRPEGVRYPRGQQMVSVVTAASTVAMLGALLAWQFSDAPSLQRSTLAQRAEAEVHQVFDQTPEAALVEVDARFTRSDIAGQNTLLVSVFAQPAGAPAETLANQLRRSVGHALRQRLTDVTPIVDVTVLQPAASESSG